MNHKSKQATETRVLRNRTASSVHLSTLGAPFYEITNINWRQRAGALVFAIVAGSTQRPIAKSNREPIIGGSCKSLAKYTRSFCLFPLVFFQLRHHSVSRRARRKFDNFMTRRLDEIATRDEPSRRDKPSRRDAEND